MARAHPWLHLFHHSQKIAKQLFLHALRVWWGLLKIMVPVSLVVKGLDTLGVITHIGNSLGPVMAFIGLPGQAALVLVTSACMNIYSGLIVFSSLSFPSLTVAQASVIGCFILVAHTVPLEAAVAKKAGVRIWYTLVLRILGAFVLAFCVHHITLFFHLFQQQAVILWSHSQAHPSFWEWWGLEAVRYLKIFGIIFGLLVLMKLLNKLRITGFLIKLVGPFLKKMGIGEHAAPLTIVGFVMGMLYGGGLIIEEAHSGQLSRRDIVYSLSFLGLCHSFIEDTLLMMLIGGSPILLLGGRILFAWGIVTLLVQLFKRMAEPSFERWIIPVKQPQ